MKLKDIVKIGLDSSAYIDFENHEYHFNNNEKSMPLQPQEIKILKCLCYAYNENDGIIENYEIFKFINGYTFDRNSDMDMNPINRAIYRLRQKITKNGESGSEQYIVSPRRASFKIILPESPFENILSNNIENVNPIITDSSFSSQLTSATPFFNENLSKLPVKEIDFAFHAGREWLNNDTRIRILEKIRHKEIKCRVIINTSSDATKLMIRNMGHPDRPYTPIMHNIQDWYEYQKKYPLFKVKISPLPLLHCYYHIKTEQEKEGIMRLHYYTYKNAYVRENYAQTFNSTSSYYKLYEEEFDYLWQRSELIDEYLSHNNH